MNIYLDIETLPTTRDDIIVAIMDRHAEKSKAEIDELRPPKNIKNQQLLDDWENITKPERAKLIQSNALSDAESEIHGTGLSGTFGNLLCVGVARDINCPEVLCGSEIGILHQLNEFLSHYRELKFIGHNIIKFDIPFLIKRFIINKIKPCSGLIYASRCKPWEFDRVYDTMTQWDSLKHTSLHDLCLALGIKSPKNGISGKDIYKEFLAGNSLKIFDYCAADVIAVRQVYSAMTFAEVSAND